jgi:hypothetical protein
MRLIRSSISSKYASLVLSSKLASSLLYMKLDFSVLGQFLPLPLHRRGSTVQFPGNASRATFIVVSLAFYLHFHRNQLAAVYTPLSICRSLRRSRTCLHLFTQVTRCSGISRP